VYYLRSVPIKHVQVEAITMHRADARTASLYHNAKLSYELYLKTMIWKCDWSV